MKKKIMLSLLFTLLICSCSGPFMPNMSELLAPQTGDALLSVDYGVEVSYEFRDDNQNLIVYVAQDNLPLCKTVNSVFRLSPGARAFPMDMTYFESFQAANPNLEMDMSSFVFPATQGKEFLAVISDAIKRGEKISFPSNSGTIISSQPQLYLQNGTYYYVVISEAGTIQSYKVKLLDPSTSGTSILEATIPLYTNSGKIDDTIQLILDHENKLVSGVTTSDNMILTPYFILSSGATMKINGVTYNPTDGTPINMAGDVDIEVTSKNGLFTSNYTLRLTSGTSNCSLLSFVIPGGSNPGLGQNIQPNFTDDTTLTGETPYGLSRANLISWISVSTGATVSVGGAPFINGETELDFSSPRVFRVTSADASNFCDYTVDIQEDVNNCNLLDLSIELSSNSGLTSTPKVLINHATKELVIKIEDPWQNLNFNYVISAGAVISGATTSTTGVLDDQNGTVIITAADGVTTKSYTLKVTADITIPNPIHVCENGTGTGEDWNSATNLENALDMASQAFDPAQEIWIKKGLYIPSEFFVIPESTLVYGGFEGTESAVGERSDILENATVLSGDVNGDDTYTDGLIGNIGDNRMELIILDGDDILIDGLTVTGSAGKGLTGTDCSGLTFKDSQFLRNNNGGVRMKNSGNIEVNGCLFQENRGSYTAAGIYAQDLKEKLIITHSVFKNNGEESGGGAFYVTTKEDAETIISYCLFSENNGGLHGPGGARVLRAKVYECEFIGNSSSSMMGGALSIKNGEVENCTFRDNSASTWGGALRFTGSVSIKGCDFINNSTTSRGGAIYSNFSDSSAEIIDCTFEGNKTTESLFTGNYVSYHYYFGGGGAIGAESAGVSVENCTFINNTTATYFYPSGKYAGNHIAILSFSCRITNCTFSGSSSDSVGTFKNYYRDLASGREYFTTWTTIRP